VLKIYQFMSPKGVLNNKDFRLENLRGGWAPPEGAPGGNVQIGRGVSQGGETKGFPLLLGPEPLPEGEQPIKKVEGFL
jgi:hypothetical protein